MFEINMGNIHSMLFSKHSKAIEMICIFSAIKQRLKALSIRLSFLLNKYGARIVSVFTLIVSLVALPGGFVLLSSFIKFKTSDCESDCLSLTTTDVIFDSCVGISLICNALYAILQLLERYNVINRHRNREGILFAGCFNSFVITAVLICDLFYFISLVNKRMRERITEKQLFKDWLKSLVDHPALHEVDIASKRVAENLFSSTWKKNATGVGRDVRFGLVTHKLKNYTRVLCENK